MARDIVIIPNRDFTGSTTHPEIRFSGLTGASITFKVEDDGSLVFEGATGGLFSIDDNKDGLLHSVSDVSGLPIFSVYSDNRLEVGKWDNPAQTIINDKTFFGPTGTTSSVLHVSGTSTFLGTISAQTVNATTLRLDATTATTANGGAHALPLNPAGFVTINIQGNEVLLPYYLPGAG